MILHELCQCRSEVCMCCCCGGCCCRGWYGWVAERVGGSHTSQVFHRFFIIWVFAVSAIFSSIRSNFYFSHSVFPTAVLSVASVQLTPLIVASSSRLRISLSSKSVGVVVRGLPPPAGLHARVILDGATCRLRELGDVRDVLSVLGVLKDR